MITLKVVTYEVDKTPDDLFSQISWQVERSDRLMNFWTRTTVDTTKPWVGKINSGAGTFRMIEPNSHHLFPLRIFEGNYFDIYVEGEARVRENILHVEVSFGIRVATAMWLVMAACLALASLSSYFFATNPDQVKGALLVPLVFAGIPGSLLLYQLQRLKRKVSLFLGAKNM
ncbi:MAG TPA: hypothetical protein PK325_07085 [Cyclobacteriaceae bacterium]|nr:hypothetical protein [Cyclobacteriaceae bacterium]HMV09423.1 hypothetical protein [Cyclobacteriaceae bacterium]HMV91468.1 hypothetical protein [Cyclobacteriaceae bacterium]HMX02444.1 hypothetical protein [Cyclobacteriaceae bacterium]HMX51068.1 hypothetical protein [Cyclobacteriaceae bacterium]